jgi:hypothetical protein
MGEWNLKVPDDKMEPHRGSRSRGEAEAEGKLMVYVASSWRNEKQSEVVYDLRRHGWDVYDFRNPEPGNTGFHWSKIDPDWKAWTPKEYREQLLAHRGRSAHLEAGWFAGAGKPLFILLHDGEPELMYRMATLCLGVDELLEELEITLLELGSNGD